MAEVILPFVAHDRNIAHQSETGGVGRHDNLAGTLMRFGGIWIGNGHHDGESGAVGCTCEPFMAVDDIVAAVLERGSDHPGWIGAGKLRFSHGKATSNLAASQRL